MIEPDAKLGELAVLARVMLDQTERESCTHVHDVREPRSYLTILQAIGNGAHALSEISNATLIAKTHSWYLGSNVEGKPRRVLSYCGGVGAYRLKCDEVAANGYQGFAMH